MIPANQSKSKTEFKETYQVPCIYTRLAKHGVNAACRTVKTAAENPLTVSVPGSKSITNRALLLATLAEGTSTLRGALFSDDSRHFLKCIQDLGFETTVDEENKIITVTGHGGNVPLKEAAQYVGSAGTAARFLTAYLGVSWGIYHMDASEQMRRRPMVPLLACLQELGCEIIYDAPATDKLICSSADKTKNTTSGTNNASDRSDGREGYFPFTLVSHGFAQNHITVDIEHSSQFLSALLIASCLSPKDFTVRVEGTHGMSYIEITRKMMEQFGVITEHTSSDCFLTRAGQHYHALDYQIEPDVSAACYFYAMAPLLNIPVLVEHVHFSSMQGDVEFLRILERLGCRVTDEMEGILVLPPTNGTFKGITVDMSACSDQAITLAAIAPFAKTATTITGIGHIRFQESNRISAIVTELSKMGIRCEETESSITIYPGQPKPSLVETYDDHRMAMGFSLIGLRGEGIVIDNPSCCRKTFENYFQVLENAIHSL